MFWDGFDLRSGVCRGASLAPISFISLSTWKVCVLLFLCCLRNFLSRFRAERESAFKVKRVYPVWIYFAKRYFMSFKMVCEDKRSCSFIMIVV